MVLKALSAAHLMEFRNSRARCGYFIVESALGAAQTPKWDKRPRPPPGKQGKTIWYGGRTLAAEEHPARLAANAPWLITVFGVFVFTTAFPLLRAMAGAALPGQHEAASSNDQPR